MNTNARNILIVLAVAAAVAFLPGVGGGLSFVSWLLGILFLMATAWFISRMYRENRVALHSLGDRRRAIVYVAGAVVALTLTATSRLWSSGPGTVAWLALLGGAGYAVFAVYRSQSEY